MGREGRVEPKSTAKQSSLGENQQCKTEVTKICLSVVSVSDDSSMNFSCT